MKLSLENAFRLSFIFMVAIFTFMPSYADANLLGSIDTNKNTYDVNDTITINYNVSSSSNGVPDSAELYMEGTMPSYNGTFLRQSDYFGRKFFEGNNIANSSVAYFKHIKSFKVFDTPDPASSFIPIPPIKGTVNAFVKSSINGEYPEFVGKINLFFDNSNILKVIHITSETPKIVLTNDTMQFKEAYTTSDTLIISYFCKNSCSIVAVDEANPASPNKIFSYGISSVNGSKTLTTSDTGEWKQIVIPLANTGYTPDDDFVRVTITDNKGNSAFATFFVYQPTADVIRLNKNVVFDVGTNFNNKVTFNDSMGLVYRTPDVDSEYRIQASGTGFTGMDLGQTALCGNGFTVNDLIINYPINGVVAPDNGINFISLQSGSIYNEFQFKFSCLPQSVTHLSTGAKFDLQKRVYALYIFPYWSVIGTTNSNIQADRININVISSNPTKVTEKGKMSFDLITLSDAIGLSGTIGHLLFALIFLVATFYVIVRIAKIGAQIAIVFDAFEIWYFAYAGFIDMMMLVIIVIIIVILYVTKILKVIRGEDKQEPPQGGEP